MADDDAPLPILRLAEAFIFASPEPVTAKALEPVLPRDFDPFWVARGPGRIA